MILNAQTKLDLFCVTVFSVLFVILMQVHLMAAVITGLLAYILVLKLDHFLFTKMQRFSHKSRLLSVLLLALLSMAILSVVSVIYSAIFWIWLDTRWKPWPMCNPFLIK